MFLLLSLLKMSTASIRIKTPCKGPQACGRFKHALLAGALLGLSAGVPAQQLPTLADARSVNEATVGIVFHFEDYYRRLIDDMSEQLGQEGELRIVPIIGDNHVQTIYDMLFMNGVDMGVVHSDVLAYIARFQNYDAVYRLINGLVELYGERIAIVANEQYESLEDLSGQKVNFGKVGKGSDITGSLLFDILGIDVAPVRLPLEEALMQVSSNTIAAHIHLLEDPVEVLSALGPSDGVRLLPLPQTQELLSIYSSGELTTDDFPNLIAPDDTLTTLSVAVMIASYNWKPADKFRYDKMSRFVSAFVDNFSELQTDKYEPIWQSVSLENEIAGAVKLPVMQDIIDNRQSLKAEQLALEELMKAEELRLMREQLIDELTGKIDARLETVDLDAGGAEEIENLLNELQIVVEQVGASQTD